MGDWLLDAAAKFEGLTDAQIAQVEASIPDLQKLLALWVQAEPILTRVTPVIQMVVNAVAIEQKEHST